MTITATGERDFEKIGSAIFLYIQRLVSAAEEPTKRRVLLFGPLPEATERTFLTRWRELSARPVCQRAFRSTVELENWRRRFESAAIDLEAVVIPSDQSVSTVHGFDFVAVLDSLAANGSEREQRAANDREGQGTATDDIVAALENLVKPNGTVLLVSKIEGTERLKVQLAASGYHGIVARSDQRSTTSEPIEIDCVIARWGGAANGNERQRTTANGSERQRTAANDSERQRTAANDSERQRTTAEENEGQRTATRRARGESVQQTIVSLVEQMLQLPTGVLDTSSPFTEFGVDSIGGVVLVNELNRRLGLQLKPTILFDYASVEKLSTYISEQCRLSAPETSERESAITESRERPLSVEAVQSSVALPSAVSAAAQKTDVAVIGISGRFPGAENVEEFWENLLAGKNSISEVPSDRWGLEMGSGSSGGKRGGFLSGAAEFDPLFFNISGREAEVTDPQHRLFLEEAYHALEDAGYTGPSAQLAKKCGVFAGVEPGDYLHVLMELGDTSENAPVFQGNAESILAARIAYFLDLKGPSIAINTACSSSLVAIHLACQSLINEECDLALAGGVRVFASEKAYLALGNMGMLSPDGQCKTFDEQADGFVPGEAVGVLVLKPLALASRDRDHIYGVIKGSAINQDGRTNGITAPSTLSQTQVELEVYEKFGLNPETFQYVEAHGTGTKLGDPIEIEALTAAFGKFTSKKSFCPIGSVKTNIGHTMAAAGVCSVIKVLLSLQHSKIPPSLNFRKGNPYIDFEHSPFFVNLEARDWPAVSGQPRRAAISSFGFSGTNSHLVLEEAPGQEPANGKSDKPRLITISAKSADALNRQLERLRDWLVKAGLRTGLGQISFTLNMGRNRFEHRCAIVASSIRELEESLSRTLAGGPGDNVWRSTGNEKSDDVIFRALAATLAREVASEQDPSAQREKLSALAALYAKGYDFDAAASADGERHGRISLPTYPFARERYWIVPSGRRQSSTRDRGQNRSDRLHPLIHRDNSRPDQIEFVSSFTGTEFFLNEHQIRGAKILPGVAYLEMAIVTAQKLTGDSHLLLKDVVWLRPLNSDQAKRVVVGLSRNGREMRFEVWSGDRAILHAEGKVVSGVEPLSRQENLTQIRARCVRAESPDLIYSRCFDAGLELGANFRTIREIWIGRDEALARLEMPSEIGSASGEFCLHPGLLDGALQTVAALGQGEGSALPVPFAVREVRFSRLGSSCYAFVKHGVAENGLLQFDIVLLDDLGQALVELDGLAMRALAAEQSVKDQDPIYLRPTWRQTSLEVVGPAQASGRLLLFDYDEELATKIRRLCPRLEVVPVIPGDSFQSFESGFNVRPNSTQDIERLLRAARPSFIIYRWTTAATEVGITIDRSILPLFDLVRELLRQETRQPVRLIVSYQSSGDPAIVALAGYARTLQLERPSVHLRLVESAVTDPSALIGELLDRGRDTEVRYLGDGRQVRQLELFTPQSLSGLPLRERSVYLISGGLGGLGKIFSRYLAEAYHARLILIGRSKATAETVEFLNELENFGASPLYLSSDVASPPALEAALAEARARFGEIHGVIHAAGIIQDGFILNKEDFTSVIRPKVFGAIALDEVTAQDPLDFFVLFSSIAGAFGNIGQSDYAYANRFLDAFARLRERKRSGNERSGVTVSISWPTWRNGGMRSRNELEIRKISEIGLQALENEKGLSIFQTVLRLGETEIIPLIGRRENIHSLLAPTKDDRRVGTSEEVTRSAASERVSSDIRNETLTYLTQAFADLVKIPVSRIQPGDPFEKFGVDSIMVMEFTQKLERDFGDLSKTLLFEYRNLSELSGYFLSSHAARLAEMFRGSRPDQGSTVDPPQQVAVSTQSSGTAPLPTAPGDIAIIGVFGRYPMADDLEQFWENLRNGKDCIVEIPPERWDYRLFYDSEPGKSGKTRNKWGGFLDGFDRFDAQFFNITPREAFALDPQERLFLETAWRTVEDAGYRKSALAGRKVGVFVGVMYGEYQLYGAGNIGSGEVFPLSSSYASIANRVSYVFDWRGPSMAIDTMCSSSLTAIHLACESLRRGESKLALAGGVNLTLHPHKDMLLSPGGFAASDGRCRSFGEGGDGYVPGEGVGAVLLKPFDQAVADGDHIYAVIKASSLNHGGKTNGYTVPSPNAQAELILESLALGQVDPTTVNYIEAHGTGTALGDPIEVTGMTRAFRNGTASTLEPCSCSVGSVKSNIGHLESAAGIAGLTKVLLQMRHGEIVPSLHSARLNPNIDFTDSIFYVPQHVETWAPKALSNNRPVRRAGISSFGAGGANAHILTEEHFTEVFPLPESGFGPVLFVLSAKNEDRLRARAEQLTSYLSRTSPDVVAVRDIAYTLQVGREPLEVRLAFVAKDGAEAVTRLASFLSGVADEGVYRSVARPDGEMAPQLLEGEEGAAFLEVLIRQRKWSKLAQFWVSGGQVAWEQLYKEVPVRRISLPSYPFAGERYWAPEKLKGSANQVASGRAQGDPVNTQSENSIPAEPSELIFLRTVWQSRPNAETSLPERADLLLFDCVPGLDNEVGYPGWSITRVIPAGEYVASDGLITIDPNSKQDYRRLVAAVKPSLIVCRWTSPTNELGEELETSVLALYNLCQALIDPPLHSTLRVLVCVGETPSPIARALAGFAQALAHEQPQIQLHVVQSSRFDGGVLAELFAPETERLIRWRDGVREVCQLEPFEPQGLAPVPLRSHGVYLITGGLGGVGQFFAKQLAREFAARLVLTGRSELTDESRSAITCLEHLGAEVHYVQCDLGSSEDVHELLRSARERFGALNGIIHAAGILRDGFLLKKPFTEFADVLRAKVRGTLNLDAATKESYLDFFALFSSTAGVFGNAGQTDYSYANAFLDAFAITRETRRNAGERYGKTVSINWPLWKDTGMALRTPQIERRLEQIGLSPLSPEAGFSIFVTALQLSEPQVVPLFGRRQKMKEWLFGARETAATVGTEVAQNWSEGDLLQKTEAYLKGILAEVTQLSITQLDSHQRFEEFGVDSIVVSDFNLLIERDLGPLPKTLLFENANFRQLTRHLVEAFRSQLSRYFARNPDESGGPAQPSDASPKEEFATLQTAVRPGFVVKTAEESTQEEIAIVGLAGRYPKAKDIRAFWDVLRTGIDCVTEIPKDRWDIDRFFDPDPAKAAEGKMYARWGAFLDEVDQFDSLFFNIAPLEAELMDPQERLFLEVAWSALEDAGYTRRDLAGSVGGRYRSNVGVFVGVTSNSYAAVAQECGRRRAIPTTLPWSLANRVSYLFNFNGPSIPVDTACSSSLTAIHLACEAIRRGECQQAIAGGVNLYLHPSRYVSLCLTRMLSTDGKCRAFGAGGTGFVPGEGVGAVFLKPLSLALADGDHIYGVIKGTAVNHGGRTNGYTVPNPAAQANLVKHALQQSNIDPRTISFIEAHGTGTSLGDPIELAGLTRAFAEAGVEPAGGFCALGSVKTNIGHLESAAGIAGLTKVLLQFKAGELAPSLHSENVNPNITLDGTPFRLQRKLERWVAPASGDRTWPRRAGISSFGAGGANAHIVVEEFISTMPKQDSAVSVLIVLSARREKPLQQGAARLAEFIRKSSEEETPLQSVAYTLQVGRESFEERIAFIVANRDELVTKLERMSAGDLSATIHRRVRRERVEFEETESDPSIEEALRRKDLLEVATLWVGGATVHWDVLWPEPRAVRRISLPTYAFDHKRYWIQSDREPNPPDKQLHPLVERSESNVYLSNFSGDEIVLRDHRIGDARLLPGAASLELAIFAASDVLTSERICLRNAVWLRPLIAGTDGLRLSLHTRTDGTDRIGFDILDSDHRTVMQGKAERIDSFAPEKLDLEEIRARCSASIAPAEIYRAFASRGLNYGRGFRVLQRIQYGHDEVLAELQVPADWQDTYCLHPALVDGAFQSLAVLGKGDGVELPFTLESVQWATTLSRHCYAYSRVQSEGGSSARRFNICLLNESGDVVARLIGLSMRRSDGRQSEVAVYRPTWIPEQLVGGQRFSGRILLFEEGTDLMAQLEEQGNSVVRVTSGEESVSEPGVVRLRRGNQEDYDKLVEQHDFDAIIHAWSAPTEVLEEGLERGLLSVHRLAKALIKTGRAAPWLFVYPSGEPIYQAVAGYAKSLKQEQPRLHLKTLGIRDRVDLVAELNDPNFEVRYQGECREVRKLDELVVTSSLQGFVRGGVYLLSGGAGGLGRIFAGHLIRKFDARLVLAGRSEPPCDWADDLERALIYVQADVSTLEGATRVVAAAKQRFGQLRGVIHAAGELRDGLIRTKSEEDFLRVARSKVFGAEALDQATCNEPLDFFVLFSSTAGLLGNAGQADYAYANAYLDAFAWRREGLRRSGHRSGRTVSINWPLWREGGMRPGEAALRLQSDVAGVRPLETADGLAAFDRIIATDEIQCVVLSGSPRRLLSRLDVKSDRPGSMTLKNDQSISKADLLAKLRELVGKVLRLDPNEIENDADTSEYGFDSVTFTTLANEINSALGLEITPAVLFEYTTLDAFAEFLCLEYRDQLKFEIEPALRLLNQEVGGRVEVVSAETSAREQQIKITESSGDSPVSARPRQAIAVVGMAGVFPGSPDLEVFWKNLEAGVDLIGKPTRERWNFPKSRSEETLPWGGFISGIDQFDPLFFDISPREAELMDPQQRLFLQTVWHTLEHAGYRRSDLAGSKTGLFVGVAANDYANLLAMAGVPIEAYSSTGNAHSVLANRISFFFDWRGPSEAIDTACSSSLVAIHRAIESMASGSCDMAMVGGVNVLLSPGAFLAFGKAGMLCEDGRCKTFDSRANGYVRGEGVGAILLKPLSRALQDRDHIYGIIRSSSENHGGHTQGLTVPNPNAQAQLLQDAYDAAGIDPFTIGYIEAHGTGTPLGDPIEVNGLKKAFSQNSGEVRDPRCAVASVKTNIGHLETAAGIAGIIKVLLAMQHHRIPGNVHLNRLNPYIQVESTPFYFPEKSVAWEPLVDRANHTLPRRAGVSSFGFGGSNCHILLEEFSTQSKAVESHDQQELFLFSARSSDRLRELVGRFIRFLQSIGSADSARPTLRQIAFTLQVGREPLSERFAVVASDLDMLIVELVKFEQNELSEALTGSVGDARQSLRLLREVHPDNRFLEPLLRERELPKLARLWVGGLDVPWEKLWVGEEVSRVALPVYPFERQRFWIPKISDASLAENEARDRLHPLLHRNHSTLKTHVYRSEFTGKEVFFRDHRVAGEPVLPGAASLELALAGASLALESRSVALRQVVWLRPVVGGSDGVTLGLYLYPESDDLVRFELRNSGSEVHVSGKAELVQPPFPEELDLAAIRSRCNQEISTRELYQTFAERGLEYGAGFRVIQQIQRGQTEVLSALEVPETWGPEAFRLHPAILDGAFQSLAVIDDFSEQGVPFAVDKVICPEPIPSRCLSHVRLASSNGREQRYDINLLSEQGRVLASISGLSRRRIEAAKVAPFYYQLDWERSTLAAAEKRSLAGPLLLFDDQVELANVLAEKEIPTIRVIRGDRYQCSAQAVTIRQENAADYAQLIREVEFGGVIHCWSHQAVSLDDLLGCGVFSVHLLVQALVKAGKRSAIRFIYPSGVPAFEAVAGYAKTLRHEQPDLPFKTIGIDGGAIDFLTELTNSDPEVRYVDGCREVRTLNAVSLSEPSTLPLKRGGVYLISGGAGGLGRVFARYLIERSDARVVVTGRSTENEKIRLELRALGKNATYVSADISSLAGAQKAVDYARSCYGEINGVLHAAGVLRDGLIWAKTLEDFEAVLGPKVRGVEALDAATSHEPLDWFVLFSSMTGLLGNPGQSDYAYANAYLDAFAHRRERLRNQGERFGRTFSINWPLWRDGGMQSNVEPARIDPLGLRPLEHQQGLEIFERVLGSDLTQVWAGIGDPEKIRRKLLTGLNKPPVRSSTVQASGQALRSELITHLIRKFAGLLKLDEKQIKPSELLESYGFDSIVAVEFSQLLEKDFGELSKTLLFEYPTIQSLATYLMERMSEKSKGPFQITAESGRPSEQVEASGAVISLDPPANSSRIVELAPTDYLFVSPHRLAIQVLYYFENRLDFEQLKGGLERVAKLFYPINSRLVPEGDRAYVIEEALDPPDFAEIVCGKSETLPRQDEPDTFEPFRVAFDPLTAGEKLAKFRLFQLERGSLLNANVSHAIADGYSYYYFLSAWAAACRSENFQIPDHSRAVLRRLSDAYREGQRNRPSAAGVDLVSLDPDFDPRTQQIETLHVDSKSLLIEARESMSSEARGWLTENSVVTALVWQTYARSLHENGELTLACPVDFRRIISELSTAFFGNASAPALIRMPGEEVMNASVGQLALRISDAIRQCDASTLIRYSAKIDELRITQGLAAIDRMALVDPRNGLIVTNVARFPLPPIDFGTGLFTREYTPVNYAGTGVIVSEGSGIKVRLAYPELIAS